MLNVPVVFFVFNRLDTTVRVFERIRAARPETLLVVADGPREGEPTDPARCQAVRDLVSRPDWPCDLRVNFAPSNLGFNRRISSGLEWAFSQFEEVIILEDDCVPDPSFFSFCTEMLARYRDDERMMMIAGCNFQFGRARGEGSYYFSQCVDAWGWASWRRAFRHFDKDISTWPSERDGIVLRDVWPVPSIVDYWHARLDEAYNGEVDAWDYQWAFAMWRNRGWQIVPNTNLISYIGCLPDTAHTKDPNCSYCNVPTVPIAFPLQHPPTIERDVAADLFEFYRAFLNFEEADCDRLTLAELPLSDAGQTPGSEDALPDDRITNVR
jgi:hypothetical protein